MAITVGAMFGKFGCHLQDRVMFLSLGLNILLNK